jgi:hypothetical protein
MRGGQTSSKTQFSLGGRLQEKGTLLGTRQTKERGLKLVPSIMKNFIERCETMAKKATKKEATKPAKKVVKIKALVSKKVEVDKKITKKKDLVPKAPVAKVIAKKEPPKEPLAKMGAPVKLTTKLAKSSAPLKEAIITLNVSNSPGAKDKENKVEKKLKPKSGAQTSVEGVAPKGKVTESASSKKAKKYEGANEVESKWLELKDKHRNVKPEAYKMSEIYQEKTPIEHKLLGWGFILSVINDRLEVLFRSGIKHLISNYKTNK